MKWLTSLLRNKSEIKYDCSICAYYSQYKKRVETVNEQKDVTFNETEYRTCQKGDMVLNDLKPCQLHKYKEYDDFYNQVDFSHAYFRYKDIEEAHNKLNKLLVKYDGNKEDM
ncbi:hypothetical protein [Brevibacillus sp. AY1]|uniref:hypothetical protein n=1 Tax=Brevibacillus sp. AY1 TaxID=2807621 RepID=UPI002453CD1F|nr:hypothetical protein [Brevibacillus sp. AY1]MDH4620102.1 hypothetical protein [Brevibacillus sp. AY1]